MNPSPVLTAVTRIAMEATGAAGGRLVTPSGDGVDVVLVAGVAPPETGISVYVLASGQPQVLTDRASISGSALCVPCICDGEVVGALELVDKAAGAAFSIDDLELAGLLAGIAGVAIAADREIPAPAPEHLAGDLERLAVTDPARYATVARLLRVLLDA